MYISSYDCNFRRGNGSQII